MPRIPVDDIHDPRLAVYRDLPQTNLTRNSGRFIAEGDKLTERLIGSRFAVDSVFAEDELAARLEPLLPGDVPIYVGTRALLQATIGFRFHRGVLACGRRQPGLTLAELLPRIGASQDKQTIVVCPDVQDPTNLGSIIRSAAAFGCEAIVLGTKCADPFSRRVLRVSMGTALQLPIVESSDLAADLRWLAAAGFERVATLLDRAAEPLAGFQRQDRTAILLGSEGHGLAGEWLLLADRRITIPMQDGVDSLNVAVAAAVVLWELCQSRPEVGAETSRGN